MNVAFYTHNGVREELDNACGRVLKGNQVDYDEDSTRERTKSVRLMVS